VRCGAVEGSDHTERQETTCRDGPRDDQHPCDVRDEQRFDSRDHRVAHRAEAGQRVARQQRGVAGDPTRRRVSHGDRDARDDDEARRNQATA
jgi:hypothetical protein